MTNRPENHSNRNYDHEIDGLISRFEALTTNHPARKGIIRTIEKLSIEAQAKD